MGIGASAGGLSALTALLGALPAGMRMAFVVVAHLSADAPPLLLDLLQRATVMPVREAEHGALVQPGHVYLIPAHASLTCAAGRFHVERPRREVPYLPIDTFFRSLAADQRALAVGVVLSGTGSDGAFGVQAIKTEGGITFAQDARTAKFDGMPLNALGTGAIDFMLPPAEIAGRIAAIAPRLPAPSAPEGEEPLSRIFTALRRARGIDFTLYRQTTIRRRIERRMLLCGARTVAEYADIVEGRPVEVEALGHDLLIRVTQFFRDPEVFDALKRQVFPAVVRARADAGPVRLWVPGCATGEEAYSMAIAFAEATADLGFSVPLQIFATDVSEDALERARAGNYMENVAMDVSPERLRRFFVRSGSGYQVSRAIRDTCVFARQNVSRDPPFSRIDLVSCRNLLIYFEVALQRRVIATYHYALRPTGFLVLGTTETAAGLSEHFTLVDKKNKIYAKNAVATRPSSEVSAGRDLRRPRPEGEGALPPSEPQRAFDPVAEADAVVMSRFAPPGVLVNGDLKIAQFRGRTGRFLEPAPGEPSLDLLRMVRPGLGAELRGAINKVRQTGAPVRVERAQLRGGGAPVEVSLEVIPIPTRRGEDGGAVERWFLVLFEEAPPPAKSRGGARDKHQDAGRAALERELIATKEYLDLTVEEHESTIEELQSANEELLSANEELQSVNEELETAKEELQSANEQLAALNEQLEGKNSSLARENVELTSVLGSVDIPIVVVGADRTIRRFTPQAGRVLNIIPTDVGRPISDIKLRLDVPDLEQILGQVIDSGAPEEREVRDHAGRAYLLAVRPHRTAGAALDGAVVLFVDAPIAPPRAPAGELDAVNGHVARTDARGPDRAE